MLWGAPLPEDVGNPALLHALLEQGIRAQPGNPALHAKLGYLHLDRHHFAAAAGCFEEALRLDGAAEGLRPALARCRLHLNRPDAALAVIAPIEGAVFERGWALLELGETGAAETQFRNLLAGNPGHAAACRLLGRILRRAGRLNELVALCEGLAARGAANAQLFYTWGWALAVSGDLERARRLMFEPDRILLTELPVPAEFGEAAGFTHALAQEVLGNPNKITEFAVEEEANRGSHRVDDLITCANPGLIRTLLKAVQDAVEAFIPEARPGFDPWPAARPAAARLRPWGLIQRGSDYEEGHIHPGGWLSGVYYVRVPEAVAAGSGPGCIEFEPPGGLAAEMPDLAPPRRYVPSEGLLLLAPSHYQHRTIPSGLDEYRVSIAFDVVPQEPGSAQHLHGGRIRAASA